MEEDFKLEIIPENIFTKRIKHILTSDIACTTCNKVVNTTFYPYGYDSKENDVWYIGLCPHCGEIMYVKD